jgi:hypothetical protein
MGRATQGVRVMRLADDEKLVSIARLAEEDVSDEGAPGAPASPAGNVAAAGPLEDIDEEVGAPPESDEADGDDAGDEER